MQMPPMPPEVLKRLIALTENVNVEVKIAAITALGEGRAISPEAISKLLRHTENVNANVKAAAAKALGRAFR